MIRDKVIALFRLVEPVTGLLSQLESLCEACYAVPLLKAIPLKSAGI
jgi:hypothetical protein